MSPSELSRAITNEEWTVAAKLARRHPDQACQWSKRDGLFDGRTAARVLPLHEALFAHAPISLIQTLVYVNPRALRKVESSYKRLPLHVACRKNADPETIAFLVEKYPHACLLADSLQRLPMHYALTNGANIHVIRTLMQVHPEAAKGCDYKGWTPVHIALSTGASPEVVKLLLSANPESVWIRTNHGTSIRSCIPSGSPDRSELLELLAETKDKVDHEVHVPDMRAKSLRASKLILA